MNILNFESTPLNERGLAENTYAVFERSAKQFPDKIALRFLFNGKVDDPIFDYTYRELLAKITQTANAFYALGGKKNNVITILLPNLPQTHFALWGAETAGIANPINPLLDVEHIIHIMNAARSTILVTLSPSPQNPLWEKIEVLLEKVKSLKAILTVDLTAFTNHQIIPSKNKTNIPILDFDTFIASQPFTSLLNERIIHTNDIACYFHTGGTTGTPKIAIHTHHNQIFSAWMVGQQLDWHHDDVIHCGLPLFHVNAPLISGLAPFIKGSTVILTSPQGFRSPQVLTNFWKLIERYKISFFMAVPTIYKALLNTWEKETNTTSLKIVACGAAPMPVTLLNEFIKRTGISVVEGYGLTEGTVFSAVNPLHGEKRTGSIGLRIPYQQMKTVLLDKNNHYVRDCETNEIGNIVIKGPNVFQGYLQTEDNKNIWVDGDWLNTGDLARQDADGYFWLTGRSKDLIIRGGHNIDPQIIEEILNQHEAIELAAAVGMPHQKLGELPIAYVTLRENTFITEEELLQFAREKISEKAAIPHHIFIIEKMPLTAVGKIFKPALRQDAALREFQRALLPLKNEHIHYDIAIQPHALYGQTAEIKILNQPLSSAMKEKIQYLLGNYAIQFNIV